MRSLQSRKVSVEYCCLCGTDGTIPGRRTQLAVHHSTDAGIVSKKTKATRGSVRAIATRTINGCGKLAGPVRHSLHLLQETLKNKAEDFMYSTAADRREAHQLEEKCAELERVVTSADVVGTLWVGAQALKCFFLTTWHANSPRHGRPFVCADEVYSRTTVVGLTSSPSRGHDQVVPCTDTRRPL